MNYFYDNLKYIRQQKQMSMEKFGKYINQSSANISRWENKNNGITVDVASEIAEKLGYSLGDLVDKDLRLESVEINNNKVDIILDKTKDLSEDDLENITKLIDIYSNKK